MLWKQELFISSELHLEFIAHTSTCFRTDRACVQTHTLRALDMTEEMNTHKREETGSTIYKMKDVFFVAWQQFCHFNLLGNIWSPSSHSIFILDFSGVSWAVTFKLWGEPSENSNKGGWMRNQCLIENSLAIPFTSDQNRKTLLSSLLYEGVSRPIHEGLSHRKMFLSFFYSLLYIKV